MTDVSNLFVSLRRKNRWFTPFGGANLLDKERRKSSLSVSENRQPHRDAEEKDRRASVV